jgi:hypothetical protein
MEENKIQPIDLTRIVRKLWPYKRQYAYVMGATLIGTYLLMVCVPRYYESEVSLAPETSGTSISGSLESLASSFGLGASLAKMNSSDAIYAEIYPDVVASRNFIVELLPVEVKTRKRDENIQCSYYEYLLKHQKAAWWAYIIEGIKQWFVDDEENGNKSSDRVSVFDHTKKQEELFLTVQGLIKCRYDKKTDIVYVSVKDQDPLVCATMAEVTCKKLQEFIIRYRTNKTRIDYEYYKKLCAQSKADYEEALKEYAASADAHRNTILATYQAKVEALENDMQAKYNIYTAMKSQMQAAAAKLQEATPAFTIIESASIPTKPAGPKRMIISIFMGILAGFVLTARLLLKKQA